MPDYAGGVGNEVFTDDMLVTEANSYRWMTEANVRRLSELIWGFLNTCLAGKAKEESEASGELDGLDGWRRVIQHIWQGAKLRQGFLRKIAKRLLAVTSLEDQVQIF